MKLNDIKKILTPLQSKIFTWIIIVSIIIFQREFFHKLFLKYPLSIIFILIVLTTFFLLKHSHRKSEEKVHQEFSPYNNNLSIKTKTINDIYFTLIGNYENKNFTLRLHNKSNKIIYPTNGRIKIFSITYSPKRKLIDEKFIIKNIIEENTQFDILILKNINSKNFYDFSCYEVILNDITFNSSIYSKMYPNLTFIDYNIKIGFLELKSSYNLWWLKDKIMFVYGYLKFHLSPRVYLHSNNKNPQDLKDKRNDTIRFIIYRVVFSIFLLLFLIVLFYSAIQFFQLVWELLIIIGEFFYNKIQ